jgi:hypothetical protein
MRFSRVLALIAGVSLPILETARRWHQLGDLHIWPMWLDDWLIGGFLLYGAWRTRPAVDDLPGRAVLASAWGFACGMGYSSAVAQYTVFAGTDPSGLPSATVLWIKIAMLGVAVAALVAALRAARK